MSDSEEKVVRAMSAYGGVFVRSLAVCFQHADVINFNKLRLAFDGYWADYKKLAERAERTGNV
jgi:hypothetical protein